MKRTVDGIRYTREHGYYTDAVAFDIDFLLARVEELEGGLREMRRVIVETMGDDDDLLELWLPFIDQKLEAGVGS